MSSNVATRHHSLCNTLINHLSSIFWTTFGQHSPLHDLKTMISQKLRIEGQLQRNISDAWFYAAHKYGGLGLISLEQWTLIRTVCCQLQMLVTPPAVIKAIQAHLFKQAIKWKKLPIILRIRMKNAGR